MTSSVERCARPGCGKAEWAHCIAGRKCRHSGAHRDLVHDHAYQPAPDPAPAREEGRKGTPICGNPRCVASTSIAETLTAGTGHLDSNGFFEHPCAPCERYLNETHDLSETIASLRAALARKDEALREAHTILNERSLEIPYSVYSELFDALDRALSAKEG